MTSRNVFSPSVLAFGAAVLLLVAAGAILGKDALPRSDETGVIAVWYLSAACIFIGLLSALRDSIRLGQEWRALTVGLQAGDNPGGHSPPRTALAALTARMADFRQARTPPHAPRESFLRIVRGRLASIGTLPRYIAGALLLLAVLGTFIGMREALPRLQEAMEGTVVGGVENPAGIIDALEAITQAFGANLIALLGSLALGTAGFGAMRERDRLADALLAFAEERLIPALPLGLDAPVLERLVDRLHTSAQHMTGAAEEVGALRRQLDTFGTQLSEALRQAEDVVGAQPLQDLIRNQADLVHHLHQVAIGMDGHAKASESGAAAQLAIAERIGRRDDELSRAAGTIAGAAERSVASNLQVSAQLRDSTGILHTIEGNLSSLIEDLRRQMVALDGARVAERERLTAPMESISRLLEAVRGHTGQLTEDIHALTSQASTASTTLATVPTIVERISDSLTEIPTATKRVEEATRVGSDRTAALALALREHADGRGARMEEAFDTLARMTSDVGTLGTQLTAAVQATAVALADTRQELAALRADFSRALDLIARTDRGG